MIKLTKHLYFYLMAVLLRINSSQELRSLIVWAKRSYLLPAPHEIKVQTLKRWGGKEVWIETGTYLGQTTIKLSEFSRLVITIEPSEKYFNIASKSLSSFPNIELWHGSSENILNEVLNKLENTNLISDLSFWLDGHYSSGETFKGIKDTPILEELEIIQGYISRIKLITICIDDIRLFRHNVKMPQVYPDLNELIDWARKNYLFWTVENDILIITNRNKIFLS